MVQHLSVLMGIISLPLVCSFVLFPPSHRISGNNPPLDKVLKRTWYVCVWSWEVENLLTSRAFILVSLRNVWQLTNKPTLKSLENTKCEVHFIILIVYPGKEKIKNMYGRNKRLKTNIRLLINVFQNNCN